MTYAVYRFYAYLIDVVNTITRLFLTENACKKKTLDFSKVFLILLFKD